LKRKGFLPDFSKLAQLFSNLFLYTTAFFAILRKDFQLEFRQRILSTSLLLFVVSACFTIYQISVAGKARFNPLVWNSLFWLVFLFSAFQAVASGFQKEMGSEFWYWFFLIPPEVLMLAKLVHHFLMLCISSLITWVFLSLFFSNPVQNGWLFFLLILLACLGVAAALTLVSAISARAGKNATLLPVLGFPLLIPTLLLVVRVSLVALEDLDPDLAFKNILSLAALDLIMLSISLLLFPYLWRRN
jgi:heme exporter protein B